MKTLENGENFETANEERNFNSRNGGKNKDESNDEKTESESGKEKMNNNNNQSYAHETDSYLKDPKDAKNIKASGTKLRTEDEKKWQIDDEEEEESADDEYWSKVGKKSMKLVQVKKEKKELKENRNKNSYEVLSDNEEYEEDEANEDEAPMSQEEAEFEAMSEDESSDEEEQVKRRSNRIAKNIRVAKLHMKSGNKRAGRGNVRINLGKPTALRKSLGKAVNVVSKIAEKNKAEHKNIDDVIKMVETVTDEDIDAGGKKIKEMMQKVYEITEGATLKVTGENEMKLAARKVKNAVGYINEYRSEDLPMLNEDTVVINSNLSKEIIDSLDRFQLTVAILTSRLRRKSEDKHKVYTHPRALRNEIKAIKLKNEKEVQKQIERREREEEEQKRKKLRSTPKRSTYEMALEKNETEKLVGEESRVNKKTVNVKKVNFNMQIESSNMTKPKSGQKTPQMFEQEKLRAERRQMGQNLNGMNINDETFQTSMQTTKTYEAPPATTDNIQVKQRTKSVYSIRTSVQLKQKILHAPTLIRRFVKTLRMADPTVQVLPIDINEPQENVINEESNLPDEESKIKKWVFMPSNRQSQHYFVFSMRISITEDKEIVKKRIYDWCTNNDHRVQMTPINSVHIFFAGWLKGVHPKFHNRARLLEWMLSQDKSNKLKNSFYIAPQRIALNNNDNTRTITQGVRVEVCFEKKNEVLTFLYTLPWEQGPYSQVQFIPFRTTNQFTQANQREAIRQHNVFLSHTKQKVVRIAGVEHEIKYIDRDATTTLQKWLQETTVNNSTKVFMQVEIGEADYVRLIHLDKHSQIVEQIVTSLYQEMTIAFGKEKTNSMIGNDNGLRVDRSTAEVETNYITKLATTFTREQPQADELYNKGSQNDQYSQISTQSTQPAVYFEKQVKSYASAIVDTRKQGEKKNMMNVGDLEERIMERVSRKVQESEVKLQENMDEMKRDTDKKIQSVQKSVDHVATVVDENAKLREERTIQRETQNTQNLLQAMQSMLSNALNPHMTNNNGKLDTSTQDGIKNTSTPQEMVEHCSHAGGNQ